MIFDDRNMQEIKIAALGDYFEKTKTIYNTIIPESLLFVLSQNICFSIWSMALSVNFIEPLFNLIPASNMKCVIYLLFLLAFLSHNES